MQSRVASLFQDKKAAFGLWLTLPGHALARHIAAASSQLDVIIVDCEHGLIPLHGGAHESVVAIATSSQSPPSAIVRISGLDNGSRAWQAKLALDSGAQGIMVPMIETSDEARAVVAACRFPPIGRRGFGSPYAHQSWGVTRTEYLKQANDAIIVCVQIETAEAIKNVESICQVPGIDLLFIGPYDLAISLGEPLPTPATSRQEELMQKVKDVAHANGKKVGIVTLTGAEAARRAAEGFDLVTISSDVGLLASGLNKELALLGTVE